MSRVLLNRSVKAIETSPSVRSGSISRCFLVNPVDLFGVGGLEHGQLRQWLGLCSLHSS